MTIWQAIILGIIQGIAEFLPISSSGHLVLLHRIFGVEHAPGAEMTFDIVVHIGSLCAVLAVFWQDIVGLVKKPLQKMNGLLIVGTLPVVIVGFTFRSEIEAIFRQGFYLAIAFAFTGILLMLADRLSDGKKNTSEKITYLDALVVGCMQAVGLPPGISRSGATITGALVCGFNREMAAKFSFLLSIIAIAGAGTLEAWELYSDSIAIYAGDVPAFMAGFAAAAVSGYFAIRLLLRLIRSCKLKYFSYYLFILAAWILVDVFVLNWFF